MPCSKFLYFITLVLLNVYGVRSQDVRVARVHLAAQNITGSVTFTETTGGVNVVGVITGLRPGKYGFHVHQMGDISTCDAAGAHFDPEDARHGGREHEVRHVGDLGNIEFVGSDVVATSVFNFTDNIISLRGRNNILGRTLVLHAGEDDLGQGNHELSGTTGNAGARVACGVIGLVSPVASWNSAITNIPSYILLFASVVLSYFKL